GKVISFGFANEPPYTIAETGNVTGQDPEVLKAIMSQYGIKTFDGVLVEFPGLIPGLQAGRWDMIAAGMTIKSARCKVIDFGNPDLMVGQALMVKAGNPKNLHSLKSIAANHSIKLGTQEGAAQYTLYQVAGIASDQISGFPTLQTAVAALQTGRVDAVQLD